MSKSWYEKMTCEGCGCHLGYFIYAGPGTGCGICVDCWENEPDEEEEAKEDE